MAFKLKKKIEEILTMDFETYAKFLKKEINRAAKFGELDAVVCANHKFADGKESSLVLIGAFIGEMAAFFKKNKSTIGFAKGKCFFETTEKGICMHIALNAGKGKPDKIKKSGKKLWSKVGVVAEFYKGELPVLDAKLDKVSLGEKSMHKDADKENDSQEMAAIKKDYLKSRKLLQAIVLPLIRNKETLSTDYTNQHFKIAKSNLKIAASFLNKYQEIDTIQQTEYNADWMKVQDEYPKIKRIAAKIKQELMAINAVDIELDNDVSEDKQTKNVEHSLDALEKEFERLTALEIQAKEALKYLEKLI
jgi:hypothetical protein